MSRYKGAYKISFHVRETFFLAESQEKCAGRQASQEVATLTETSPMNLGFYKNTGRG